MKYAVVVVLAAPIIGLVLSLAVNHLLGADVGYFFAKFIAGQVGLVGSFVLFVVYDHLWTKRDEGAGR